MQNATIRPLEYVWKDVCRYMFLADQLIIDTYAHQLFLLANTTPIAHNQATTPLRTHAVSLPPHQEHNFLNDVIPFIPIEQVLTRFCTIQKITPLINRLGTNEIFKNIHYIIDETPFSHPAIILCIQQMIQSKSITPFCVLSEQFNQYYYLQDAVFIKDYYTVLYHIYAHIYEQINHSNIYEQASIKQLLHM